MSVDRRRFLLGSALGAAAAGAAVAGLAPTAAAQSSIPAPLGEETTELIQSLAVETFHALNCTGLARVDFFVTDSGPVLNEINTMPGFTPISMYPKVFEASGVPYAELLDIVIQQALSRR